ncbi:MAG TPA: hypothetical protein P5154_05240 [Candidatus Izemoplasmatales bacterium]|nr:hypothetical protein [Bacillota bacterium]HRY78151.1 hypothetical protein [Candidatus Izemoplasmatales bacterium]
MDDFFLPKSRVTPERLAEVGGNIDYERFAEEVVTPWTKSLPIRYRRFDCGDQVFSNPIELSPTHLLVVEGVYSLHPLFRPMMDLKVMVTVNPWKKALRILLRNGSNWRLTLKHLSRWIPLENRYFRVEKLSESVDRIVRT